MIEALAAKMQVILEQGPFPNPRLIVRGDPDETARIAHILIPQESKEKKRIQVLSHLTFELFNAKNTPEFESLVKRADRGEVALAEYASSTEKIEHQAHAGRNRIFSQCAKTWNLEGDPLLEKFRGKPVSFETYLFETETSCHTDSIRKRWIENYQKQRCKKYPEDTVSCTARKADLCDYSQVQAMPKARKDAFIHERTCSFFSNLLPGSSPEENETVVEAMKEQGCPTPHFEL